MSRAMCMLLCLGLAASDLSAIGTPLVGLLPTKKFPPAELGFEATGHPDCVISSEDGILSSSCPLEATLPYQGWNLTAAVDTLTSSVDTLRAEMHQLGEFVLTASNSNARKCLGNMTNCEALCQNLTGHSMEPYFEGGNTNNYCKGIPNSADWPYNGGIGGTPNPTNFNDLHDFQCKGGSSILPDCEELCQELTGHGLEPYFPGGSPSSWCKGVPNNVDWPYNGDDTISGTPTASEMNDLHDFQCKGGSSILPDCEELCQELTGHGLEPFFPGGSPSSWCKGVPNNVDWPYNGDDTISGTPNSAD